MFYNLRSYFSQVQSASVGAAFLIMSLFFGTWITRIPDIKLQAGLSEGELGMALLGMPIGALSIMAFMGPLIHRFGAGKVTWVSSMIYVIAMITPAFATNAVSLAGALLLVGISAGSMDVAMNAAAASIEQQLNKLIMSTSHAMFSFGGMVGAGVGSLAVGLGVSTVNHFFCTAIILLVVTFFFMNPWLSITDHKDGSYKWAWPSRSLALLAFVGFCVLLSEGAIADWSAVYLRETLGGSSFIGGLGFAGFSLTMALGRFYGDVVIPKWGSANLVRYGGLLAGSALGVALLIGNPVVAISGFTLAGLGISCVVPVIFSAAAKIPGISSGAGIAAISSMGYVGFMAGPPAIGFVAETFGLSYGLGLVAALCLLFGLLASGGLDK